MRRILRRFGCGVRFFLGNLREFNSEDYWVDLRGVTVIELAINPDVSVGDAACRTSLAEMRLA